MNGNSFSSPSAVAINRWADATAYSRHPSLNLPARAICLHKGPASKTMLVWLWNYRNSNSKKNKKRSLACGGFEAWVESGKIKGSNRI